MDETDGWFFAFGLAALAIGMMALSRAVRDLQADVALLRITAAVPDTEGTTDDRSE